MSTATRARERPILMSGPMVRAILAGHKTQTRRVVKPQPPADRERCWVEYPHGQPMACYESFPGRGTARTGLCECPFGGPGSRLWVRETFAPRLDVDPAAEPEKARRYALYRADGTSLDEPHWHAYPDRWTPSIFMPRWASRITLEIESVRVERLQAITHEDAVAEGFGEHLREPTADAPHGRTWGRLGFSQLWDKINGPGSWDASPWVWVVSFRRIDGIGGAP